MDNSWQIARWLWRVPIGLVLIPLGVTTAPLWLPLLFLGFATEVVFIPLEAAFQWKMYWRRRLSPFSAIDFKYSRPGGTLIVDTPHVSYGFTRLWWTADDIHEIAPIEPPSEIELDSSVDIDGTYHWPEFFEWCTSEYLDEHSGSGMLVSVWNGRKMAKWIGECNPEQSIVMCASGGKAYMASTRGQ